MLFAEAAELGDNGEGAYFYERVADQIEEHGGEGHQNVASVGDGAVGEHALDVGLHERAEVTGKHGEHGENPEGPEPEMRGGRNRGKDAQEQRERGGFRSRGEERGDWRGRAFVDIGSPALEGSECDFKAETDQYEREA